MVNGLNKVDLKEFLDEKYQEYNNVNFIDDFGCHATKYSPEKIKHIPTYLHHSKNDKTSKFSMAELAYKELSKINNNVEFNIGNSGHSGWGKLYADKEIINWLLSWKKNKK